MAMSFNHVYLITKNKISFSFKHDYFLQINEDPDAEYLAFGANEPTVTIDPLVTAKPAPEPLIDDGKTPKVRDGRFFPADSTTSKNISTQCVSVEGYISTLLLMPLGETDLSGNGMGSNKFPWSTHDDVLPTHLRIGEKFRFTITIIDTRDVPPYFSDIFCQFA